MDWNKTTNLTFKNVCIEIDKTSTDASKTDNTEHYVQDCKDILNEILELVWSTVENRSINAFQMKDSIQLNNKN